MLFLHFETLFVSHSKPKSCLPQYGDGKLGLHTDTPGQVTIGLPL